MWYNKNVSQIGHFLSFELERIIMEIKTETKVITEATSTFDEKFNILIQQMSRKGFNYKDMKMVDNHSTNKITAVVIFEKRDM